MADAAPRLKDVNDPDLDDENENQEPAAPRFVDTPKFRREVRTALMEIENLQAERKQINEQITAKLSELATKGIPKQAAKEAIKRWSLTEEQRSARDGAYALCLKALDIGFQADLFVDDGSST